MSYNDSKKQSKPDNGFDIMVAMINIKPASVDPERLFSYWRISRKYLQNRYMPSLTKPCLPKSILRNPRDSLPNFFRQTGLGRDNLPNSANWVSGNCPYSGVYAQFAETQFAETQFGEPQFAESEGQFAEFFFVKLGKVVTICRIRQTGFRRIVRYSQNRLSPVNHVKNVFLTKNQHLNNCSK